MEKYICHRCIKFADGAHPFQRHLRKSNCAVGTKKSACKAVIAIVRNNRSLLGPQSSIFFPGMKLLSVLSGCRYSEVYARRMYVCMKVE